MYKRQHLDLWWNPQAENQATDRAHRIGQKNTVAVSYTHLDVYKRQGTGQVVNENGYRYEGKNQNNYIWFNNELWRIIGVFDEASHLSLIHI